MKWVDFLTNPITNLCCAPDRRIPSKCDMFMLTRGEKVQLHHSGSQLQRQRADERVLVNHNELLGIFFVVSSRIPKTHRKQTCIATVQDRILACVNQPVKLITFSKAVLCQQDLVLRFYLDFV